jgi:hypothetical protein
MAQTLTTSFIQVSVPGSYAETLIKSDPVGVAASGVIAIIGEADGGDDHTLEDVKQNFFGPSQVDRVTQKYVSGNIVDAMRMLSAPSADADITGAPTRIYILKTNTSTKASALVEDNYGTIRARVAGAAGNRNRYEVTQTQEEIAPELSGNTISNFAALAGVEFGVRLNGGAVTSLDVFTGLPDDYDTIAEVIALIDADLPAGMSCVAGSAPDSIKIMVDPDALAHEKGWGKSFELVEITAGGLAALGLEEGIFTSAAEPRVQIDVRRSDINLNESFSVAAELALTVGYEGTTATMTITAETLSTSVTGGAGANLNIQLSQYQTIKDLADFIAAQPGYSAQALVGSTTLSPSALDKVTAIGICSSSSEMAGRVKKSVFNVQRIVNTSVAVQIEISAVEGLPAETATGIFLAGGAKGSTSAANIVAALDKLEGINVNFVVPLFSRNSSEDIAEGMTESASSYSISAINAAVRNHCLKMSTAKAKKNRTAYLSLWGAYQDAKSEASTVSNARMSLSFQKVSQVDAQGEIKVFMPWMAAVNAAGMQAAGFYRSILNKFANIISYVDPAGYDSNNLDDQEDALLAGLLPLTQDISGSKWLSDQTTYTLDQNFVLNSSQLMYVSDLLSLDMTGSLERAFVGKSLADVDASTVFGFVVSKADAYKGQKLISASSDAPAGFKNLKVNINGPVVQVAIEFKPSNSIYFLPITITLSQISSEA